MKVLHTISSIDKNSGGTSTYLQLLANELTNHVSLAITALQTKNPLQLNDQINVFFAKSSFSKSLCYSPELKHHLKWVDSDLFHGNGLWQYPVHAMAAVAQNRNIPYIISPHGMLEPWSLKEGELKKKLALTLFQGKDIKNASCIHATAQMEAENIRNLGFKNPIAVIPNGIDINEFPLKPETTKKEKQTILFLSRIHPKKGIELLVDAWQQLNRSLKEDWMVEIAGNGEQAYVDSLQQKIKQLGLEDQIKIIGPQFGANKLASYHRTDLFILPTYSENFGIVVAEALACGVPVITTKGTPWEELNTHKAGWWIDIDLCYSKQ